MIRLVDVGKQINEWENLFSFYDTIINEYVEIWGCYTFDRDFPEDLDRRFVGKAEIWEKNNGEV